MKEIERKSRTSPTRETLLWNKSRRSLKLLKKNQWPRTLLVQSSKFWEPASQLDAPSISNHQRKSSPRSPEENLKSDSQNLFKHSILRHFSSDSIIKKRFYFISSNSILSNQFTNFVITLNFYTVVEIRDFFQAKIKNE